MREAHAASLREVWFMLAGVIVFVAFVITVVDGVGPPWPKQPTVEPTTMPWDHYVARFSDADKWLLPTPALRQALPSTDPGATRLGD